MCSTIHSALSPCTTELKKQKHLNIPLLIQLITELHLLNWCIHSSKLKERILSYFPDMVVAHEQGRVFVAREDIGYALIKACDHDAYSDAVLLARAAKIIRKDMLAMKQRSFGSKCQEESVPSSLLALVSMVCMGLISRFSQDDQKLLNTSSLLHSY